MYTAAVAAVPSSLCVGIMEKVLKNQYVYYGNDISVFAAVNFK